MLVTLLTISITFTSHTTPAVFHDSRNVFVSDDRHIISLIDVPASDITLFLSQASVYHHILLVYRFIVS